MVKHIYFSNRKEYYRRQRISAGMIKYWAEKKREVVDEKVKRFSISFIKVRGANSYDETPRAYILNPKDTNGIFERLTEALKEKTKGNGWYICLSGLEEAEIDLVEAGDDERNKILFEGV